MAQGYSSEGNCSGCAWLLLSVSPQKCSLISSELAATRERRSIDNQSVWRIGNLSRLLTGSPIEALCKSAGRGESTLRFPSSFFSSSSAGECQRLRECGSELAFKVQRGGCSSFTTLKRLHVSFGNRC